MNAATTNIETLYSVDDLLELDRQFAVYDTLLFCPGDHAHVDNEMICERGPGEVQGRCSVCGKEVLIIITPETCEQKPRYSSLRQGKLLLELRVSMEMLRKDARRVRAACQELFELRCQAADLCWRSARLRQARRATRGILQY